MAKNNPNQKPPFRNPREDRTAMYITAGGVALALLGILIWAASDYTPINPPTPQTESEQQKTNPTAQ